MRDRRRRPPQPVRDLVGRVLGDLGLGAAERAFEIGERWESLVGEETALHCRPVAVRGHSLEAEVDTSVWCQQLRLRAPEILAALRREFGEEAPRELRLRVATLRSRPPV